MNPTTPVCSCGKPICDRLEALKYPRDMDENDRHHVEYFCHGHQPKEEVKGERCGHESCEGGEHVHYRDDGSVEEREPCPSSTNPKKEDWEEEFDKEFPLKSDKTVYHGFNQLTPKKLKSFISRLLAEARREGVKDATDKLWHALLFGSSCHQVKIEGASSYPCVCCAASVKAVGEAIDLLDRVKPESRKE